MSQAIPADIDPDATSGTELSTVLNDFKDAIASGFTGTSRPANLQAGGYWLDTTNAAGPNFYWIFKIFNGADDIEVFRVNISTLLSSFAGADSVFTVAKVSNDAVGPILKLTKSRSVTTLMGQVKSGDVLGEIRLYGEADDDSTPIVAKLKVVAVEDETSTAAGAYISVMVATTGTVTPVEAMRLGDIIEAKFRLKQNSLELVPTNVATTATIAQLNATTALVEMTGSTATSIQGINSLASATKVMTIHNRSTANVTLANQNGTATANDRMKLPNGVDFLIVPQNSVELYYCTTDSRWKIKSGVSSPASSVVVAVSATTKATTIDWSQGLSQKLSLQEHTVISFSNPVEGAVHTLIICQDTATVNAFSYNFNMPTQDPRRSAFQPGRGALPVGNSVVYQWTYSAGVRPAVTGGTSQISFAPAPPTLITGLDLSPDGKTLVGGQTSSPYNVAYDITEHHLTGVSPFGLKNINTPATLAAQALNIAYAKDNKTIFTVGGTTPYVQGWNTDRGIAKTVFANNVTLPTGAGKCVAMCPNGFSLAVGHATSPYISVYPYIGNFSAGKATDSGTLPPGAVTGICYAPQSDFISIASKTSPFIRTWAFSPQAGAGSFNTVVADPTTPADGPSGLLGRAIAWRPQGDFIAMAMDTTPYIYVVPFNRTTAAYGTPLTVTNVPAGVATCVAWTPCGQFLLVGCATSPYFYIYDFSASLLNSNVTLNANPSCQVNDIVVHPHGEIAFLALNADNFLSLYALPNKARSYIRMAPLGL